MHATHSPTYSREAADALTVHSKSIRDWEEERGLGISAPTPHVTLFTSDTHQSYLRPTLTLDNSPLPLERHRILLGVTFSQHVQTVKKKAAERLKSLKP